MNPQSTGPDALNVWTLILTPILSFAACILGSSVAIRSDNRLQDWRLREERFRILCWAVDLRSSPDQQFRKVGENALAALRNYKHTQKDDDLVCLIANSLPTNDRWQRPYAEAADAADAVEDSNPDAKGGN